MADCLGSSQNQVPPQWFDPLGPSKIGLNGQPKMGLTGGPRLRTDVFNQLSGLQTQGQQQAATTAAAATAAANSPGNAAAANLATRQINGDFLGGSPQLDAAMAKMRGASNAETANNNARIDSSFARNGMNFSTANQEAKQADQAAQTASANNTEAQARLQNYDAERQIQQTSPQMLQSALSAPINYLSSIPNDYLAPLSQEAQIIAGLAGNGQIAQPDTVVTPGYADQTLAAVGSAA